MIRQINTEVLCNCFLGICCYSLSCHIGTLGKKELNKKEINVISFFIAWKENEI